MQCYLEVTQLFFIKFGATAAPLLNKIIMLQRLSNPKSVFAWWIALGLILGLIFAQVINSLIIGLPMGIALSLLIGKATYRISRGLTRTMR